MRVSENDIQHTIRPKPFERAISCDEPLAAVVLGMLAVPRAVVVDGIDASVLQLLRQLPVPVDVGEGLSAAVRFPNRLDLHAKVVVSHAARLG